MLFWGQVRGICDSPSPKRPDSVISDVCVDDSAASLPGNTASANTSHTVAPVGDVLSPDVKDRHQPLVSEHVVHSRPSEYEYRRSYSND